MIKRNQLGESEHIADDPKSTSTEIEATERALESRIEYHIANAASRLSELEDLIKSSFLKTVPIVTKELNAQGIDIIFLHEPKMIIPELGVGGYADGSNRIYVSVDPESDKITEESLFATLLHEFHHCARERSCGYGESPGEAIISEGLACLYEEEHLGKAPICTNIILEDKQIQKALRLFDETGYDQSEWFFGTGSFDAWFGYALGYKLCKGYSEKTGKPASQLVDIAAANILNKSAQIL